MTLERNVTPLPEQEKVPVQFPVGDWFDLGGGETHTLIDLEQLQGQAVQVEQVSGRPETDVAVEVIGDTTTDRGSTTNSLEVDTTAQGSFDEPVDQGPLATERLRVRANNRSGTDYTQAQGTPYQVFLNYTVRELTILEKLNRGIPLTNQEAAIAKEFDLGTRERLGMPPAESAIHQASLEDKRVKDTDAFVTTFDIDSTGKGNGVEVANLNVRRDEVIYLTGLKVNSQAFTYGDDLTFDVKRVNNRDFWEIETYGVPGQPYEMEMHVPFFDRLIVNAYAANTINNVDVQLEYATVERTLLEKALYDLEQQVKANDDLADRRVELFDKIQTHLQTGLPLSKKALLEATAPDLSAQPTQSGR